MLMRKRLAAYPIGTMIAIAAAGWVACGNGAGPSTVPEPRLEEPPAPVEPRAGTRAAVPEMAALTPDHPPMPPGHRCLNDASGAWQVDDGKRCVANLTLNDVTGWHRGCGHNRAYFPEPDWRCCVDDGLGQCVPGSEASYEGLRGGSEGAETEEDDPEDPPGLRVWIYGTSPPDDLELCEGDFIHALGVKRSDSEGQLRGSVYLVDPELAALEETGLLSGYAPIEGEFAFQGGEDQITSYALDRKRIAKCPKCSELRTVRLGINHRMEIEDADDPDKTYEIGDELLFRIRKATDERCLPG